MPLYDLACTAGCGVVEVRRHISDVDGSWHCPACGSEARQVYSPIHARIDSAETIGDHRTGRDAKVKGVNLGLPGEFISQGRDSTGKERFDYRPRYSNTIASNRQLREIAKRNNLTPHDSGAYRSTRG